jgi:hypothetical protein
MTYSFVVDVPAPIEMYDATHAAVAAAAGWAIDGLLVHIGRATDTGFQVVEVWESKEHCERFNQTVVGPAIAALTGGQPMPQPPIASFDVRGLVIPSGKILI